MTQVKIKRTMDLREADVASDLFVPTVDRHIWYEVYVNDVFVKSFDDVCDALDYKESVGAE